MSALNKMKKILFSFFTAVAVFGTIAINCPTANAQNSKGFHLLNQIHVGGEGGWDGLTADPEGHRLYVSHATHLVVIDTATDKVVGDIPGTNGIHCIAINRAMGRGYTTNGRDNTVTVFDLNTLKSITTVPTGKNPDAIAYDPSSKRVFAFNGGSSNVTVIDAADNKVAGTVDLGGKPEFATADGKGTVYVNLEDKSQVLTIDAAKMTVKNRWAIAPGEEPTGIGLDVKNKRLFIACGNKKMVVMDAESGKVLADFPTGDGTDGLEFDPGTRNAFASNGEGTLTVVHEDSKDKFSVVENATTQRGARTIAVDNKTHKVYLPTAEFGETPAPTKERPRPRPSMKPDTFVILVYGK
jgi:YVTN family beta-propeller protein